MNRKQQDRQFAAIGYLHLTRVALEDLLEGNLTDEERERIDEALDHTLKAIDAI